MAMGSPRTLSSNVGLSKLLGKDAGQFILLDQDTDGRCGRAVYINLALSATFAGIEQSARDLILHRLKSLRATAGGANSYSNIHDAMEHKTLIGSAFVHYKMLQASGSAVFPPGVYITGMEVASYGQAPPGLYRVTKRREDWEVEKQQAKAISTDFAAINGACRGIAQAASEVLPEMLDKAYSGKKWRGDLNSEGYTLFFNPPCLYDSTGAWKTPQQKAFSKNLAAVKLARAMAEASRRQHPVQWVVHGDGAHIMHDALQQLPGVDLSNHTLLFAAPTKSVAALLPALRQCSVKLHDDVIKVQDADWRSKQTQMWHSRKLERELRQIPGLEDQAAILAGQHRRDLATYVNSLIGAAATGVALASPAVPGLVSVGLAAVGIYATWDKMNHLRNIASTAINIPGLNPHMHPFDSSQQMNHRARKHSGNAAKTFVDVVKARLGRSGGI